MVRSFFLYVIYFLLFIVLCIVAFLFIAPQFGSNPTSDQITHYKTFKNFKDGAFESLEKTPMMTGEISTWEFFMRQENRKPDADIIPKRINLTNFNDLGSNKYKIAWLGHSAFMMNIDGKVILLDPMLGTHAAPVPLPSLKRFNNTLPINLDSLSIIDIVIISHDHYDHLDYSTIKKIRANVELFLVPLGVGNHLRRWNVAEEKIIELNWNENYLTNELTITCLPSRHFSGRGPTNRNSTLWGSWSIRSSSVKIYFSGDSGYGKHFKQIGDEYGPFDISLIDCGQYNKAWKYSHMFPSEAILAAKDLKTEFFMPIHWGGFTLAMHQWDEPVEKSIRLADEIGLKYFTPLLGEVITEKSIKGPFNKWWVKY